MKKLLTLIIALVLATSCFAFVGCGKKGGSQVPAEFNGKYTEATLAEVTAFESSLGSYATLNIANGASYNRAYTQNGTEDGTKFNTLVENNFKVVNKEDVINGYTKTFTNGSYGGEDVEYSYYDGSYFYQNYFSGEKEYKIKSPKIASDFINEYFEWVDTSFGQAFQEMDDLRIDLGDGYYYGDRVVDAYFALGFKWDRTKSDTVKIKAVFTYNYELVDATDNNTIKFSCDRAYYFLYKTVNEQMCLTRIFSAINTEESETGTDYSFNAKTSEIADLNTYNGAIEFPNDLADYVAQ